jgi:RimJ/RimL family protein N-acetyltransferase
VTPTTTTERLTLRSLIDVDLPELVALNGDPEVMPFITGRALTPAELEAEHEAAAEIGWRLPRSRWGRGLATEGARAARSSTR